MDIIKKLYKFLLNLIFVPKCIFCKKILSLETDFFVCEDCLKTLPYVKGFVCKICGKPIDMVYGNPLCFDCKNNKIYFEKAISVFFYEKNVRNAVISLKFHKNTFVAKTLAGYMAEKAREFKEIDYITFVPLHKKRLKKRGYNQSFLLAQKISENQNIPILENLLIKSVETKVQSSLSKKERIQNIKNSFEVNKEIDIKNKVLLLVDDVLTTGATANECAKMLKKSGAKRVFVLTLAVTKLHN